MLENKIEKRKKKENENATKSSEEGQREDGTP
jgi:hypothetical protein